MTAIKLLAAVYMVLMAVAVAVQFIAYLFYDSMQEGASPTVWRILTPMMVAAVVMALLSSLATKLRLDGTAANGCVDRKYLETNLTLYFSAVFLVILLWNWIAWEWAEPSVSVRLLWIIIDATFPVLIGSAGIRLLRQDSAFYSAPGK